MSSSNSALERFRSLYLNPAGADVWFVFDGERIPAHKLILTTMSPWLNTMFFGSLPENKEVHMTEVNASIGAFKEFLRFIYMDQANLTMENIEGVIHLAKQSLSDHIFNECEEFLIRTMTTDTMCYGYQLALLYDAKKLKRICEEEICVNAEQVLKSSSFLEFPHEFLQNMLQCDALACEEKDIFDACIAWAKAACKRNSEDPLIVKNLRAQLQNAVFQIRFISMQIEEFANCISSYSALFTATELHEIVCMIGRAGDVKSKKFNWTPRYYDLQWNKGRDLECRRFVLSSLDILRPIKDVETTTFTCNRRILLKGFSCECNRNITKISTFEIIEKKPNGTEPIERYSDQVILDFQYKRKTFATWEAKVQLNKPILLRPKYIYDIKITIKPNPPDEPSQLLSNNCGYKSKVIVDFDILIRFEQINGMISALSLSRFDNKHFLQKIVKGPLIWAKAPLTNYGLRI